MKCGPNAVLDRDLARISTGLQREIQQLRTALARREEELAMVHKGLMVTAGEKNGLAVILAAIVLLHHDGEVKFPQELKEALEKDGTLNVACDGRDGQITVTIIGSHNEDAKKENKQ